MSKLREFGFADGDLDSKTEEKDGLIWKPILRAGEFKLTPTNKGIQNKPFYVVSGKGKSDTAKNVVSIDDVIESYKENAFEHVTIPTSHKDDLLENTGFIRELKKDKDEKGRDVLLAGLEFTEEEIKGKVERGTIPNCSSGIFFDHVRKADKKRFPVALKHVALTDTPWITELKPFGKQLTASDEGENADESIEFYQFSDDADDNSEIQVVAADSDEVIWKEEQGYGHIREALNGNLNNLSKNIKVQSGEEVYFFVQDVSSDKALIRNESTNISWVAPYSLEEDQPVLSAPENWIEAKQIMVAASDEVVVDNDSGTPETKEDPNTVTTEDLEETETKIDPQEKDESTNSNNGDEVTLSDDITGNKPAKSDTNTDSSPMQALKRARANRQLQASDRGNNSGGKTMAIPENLDLDSLELSDDNKAAIKAAFEAQDENKELNRTVREREVDSKIDELKGLGLSEKPGLLKFARGLYLSDDAEPSAVILSDTVEDQDEDLALTASEIFDKTIEFLKNDEGKLELSDQASQDEAGEKPSVGEEVESDEVAVTAAVEALEEDDPARALHAEDKE